MVTAHTIILVCLLFLLRSSMELVNEYAVADIYDSFVHTLP